MTLQLVKTLGQSIYGKRMKVPTSFDANRGRVSMNYSVGNFVIVVQLSLTVPVTQLIAQCYTNSATLAHFSKECPVSTLSFLSTMDMLY